MLKRIWATVDGNDFFAFQQKARQENLDMGQALSGLVHMYATGSVKVTCPEYLEAIRKADSDFIERPKQ